MRQKLGWGALVLGLAVAGCSGDKGPMSDKGDMGDKGDSGTGTPSVSAVTPSQAYLGRTIDLTISGSEATWSSAATVSFADANIEVNKVTVASASGIVANVTIGDDTALVATDVTVSDGGTEKVYKGALQIKAPLEVSVDQTAGVPQGGIATVHVRMLDVDTPFAAEHVVVESARKDLAFGKVDPSAVKSYAFDVSVRADVLAAPGDVDLKVSSGDQTVIGSPAKKAFAIAARTPAAITGKVVKGTLTAPTDTALFQLVPASEQDRFLQIKLNSADGGAPVLWVMPKTGKYADAVSAFTRVFGKHLASVDPYYLVVQNSSFAAPPPYGFDFNYTETQVTASAEAAEAASTNNDTANNAVAIATLPGLVTGTLGYDTVMPSDDADYFKVSVAGASASAPKSIHVATGGDGLTDTLVEVFDTDGITSLDVSSDADVHEDLVVSGIQTNGTYFIKVTQSGPASVNPAHNTYELFVEVK